MSDDEPKVHGTTDEKPVEQIIQDRKDQKRDRRIVATALSLALVSVLSVAAIALVFAIQRGENVDKLAPALDASRQQVEYCAQPNVPKTDPKCQKPVVPAAKEIVGPTGAQGIQGPIGLTGPQGPMGPQGPRGLPGTSPRCLLEPSRCVGKPGADSTVPGPTGKPGADSTVPGPTGKPGADSTIPGPEGPQGKPGADSTVPGPEGPQGKPGADSTVPGPTGPPGPAGMECPAGYTAKQVTVPQNTMPPSEIVVWACVQQ